MLTFKMKTLFFDRKAVLDRIGAASAKALSAVGGRIRKTAQRSMRYRKKPSAPGTPPSAHRDGKRGPLLRDKLFYGLEPDSLGVVIGPVGFSQKFAIGTTVPGAHEFGGTLSRKVRMKKSAPGRRASAAQSAAFKRKVKSGQIRMKAAPFVIKKVTLPKRPFMGPALRTNIAANSTLSVWKDSMRAA